MDKILGMEETASLQDYKSHFRAVFVSSLIGQMLTSAAMKSFSADEVKEAVERILPGMKTAGKKLTESGIVQKIKSLKADVEALLGSKDLAERREIEVDYRNLKVKMTVKSAAEEAELRVRAAVR
eukprot:3308230-Amphidinium_carterae.1